MTDSAMRDVNLTHTPLYRLLVAVFVALLLLPPAAMADAELRPEPIHADAAPVVGQLLSRYHYRDQALGDSLSREVYEAYFEALDPERHYFLASDLQDFRYHEQALDDELRQGRLDTAFAIFKRYRERVKERSEYALEVLAEPLPFDTTERLELDRRDAAWATDSQELDTLWRKRVIHDALTQKLSGRELDDIRESLGARYERLARTLEQYSPDDVFQAYMSTWASRFDPHSSYMSPRRSENFDINMRLSLEGIGAMLRSEGDFVEIVELITGGPAAASGELSPGDRIVGVGQSRDSIEDVVGWRLGDVVDLIRGPKDSKVYLRTLAAGSDARETTVVITRNRVELDAQAAQAEVREVVRDGTGYRIGVIDLPAFYADFAAANAGEEDYRNTTADVERLLASDTLSDIDGLIIDLRGNTGGSLEEAVRLTGLFIDSGPVVQVHRSNGRREVLSDPEGAPARYTGPLGVMVDRHSASASEIFAAAMQDYGRGVVMGDQTFGKGTVQTLVGLDRFGVGNEQTPSGRLKLTIAKFYRINGNSTQLEGVMPDLEMPYPHANGESGERAADNALPWDTIRSADYRRSGALDEYLSELRRRHDRRLQADPALVSVAREADRIQGEQARTWVSLNESERRERIDASENARLEAVNDQLRAYGLDPLENLDALEPDTLPDILLDEGAEVLADLVELMASPGQLAAAPDQTTAQAGAR